MDNQALYWRYATKQFDSTKKLKEDDLNQLLEALRLAPSSFGLQPWKFIMVKDVKLRRRLRLVAWNQAQVTDASHLLVLCARRSIDSRYIDAFIDLMKQERRMSSIKALGYRTVTKAFIKKMNQEQQLAWAAKQVYIALGFLLLTAAQLRIDACPMEGFSRKLADRMLSLDHSPYTAVVLCALGYRAATDHYAQEKKVRWPVKDCVQFY
ncbi:NAD(P)H-dependent oxidoreductase [Patescibacteria group bacterium]|nr:NAD(P)H-dependent oxidoreductase [Patescibacteria group bacterium]MCL5091955.1 NAD(P)H-dependent oxidoreductase [Patescibacteria group bacterium]